jgi:hypothetical protein
MTAASLTLRDVLAGKCTMLTKIDPWITKRQFADARNWSLRTLDRKIKARLVPRGQLIDEVRRGYRASMVDMTLEQLEELAKAQPDDGIDREALAAQMRAMGAKGGRRPRRAA